MDYCRPLTVDGANKAYWCTGRSAFEDCMRCEGYPGIPKEGIKEICKQDIIDHPEKFEPFIYAECMVLQLFTLTDLVKVVEFDNDRQKWNMKKEIYERNNVFEPDSCSGFIDMLQDDIKYIKEHRIELYKELLGRNKVSDPSIGFDATKDTKKYPEVIIKYDNKICDFYVELKQETINNTTKETKPKSKSAEKSVKQNTPTVKQLVKQEEQKPSINLFVDAMKSLTPEQLNMKLDVTGNGEQVKEIMSTSSEPGKIKGAPVAKAHTAKDIDFNNPTELIRVDEINYTYIAEVLD